MRFPLPQAQIAFSQCALTATGADRITRVRSGIQGADRSAGVRLAVGSAVNRTIWWIATSPPQIASVWCVLYCGLHPSDAFYV
ncbi:unnamed protein product [Linum trigynum]|uniref:Uncharacterized protein n=1 Tax=Linum trigynum TaxID=586398 RepID=A0AAV2GS83_9ROSI